MAVDHQERSDRGEPDAARLGRTGATPFSGGNRRGDNRPVEVAPNPDPELSLPVHQIALVVNGIHLLENMKLDELAAKGADEFAFVIQPLKLRGGTGSTVAPAAIR